MRCACVDVLIVGLGPAGGAAAGACARSGLDTLAIDRRQAVGAPVQCAEYVPLPLLSIANGAGIKVQSVSCMRTMLPSMCEQASPFPGLMIDRARFDQSLADSARVHGARLALATHLVDLDAMQSMAMIRSGGSEQRVRYRVLIAADGPGSKVARLLGLARLRSIHTRQYTVPLTRPSDATEVFLSCAYPGGYAWLFPKRDSANLGVGFETAHACDFKPALDRLHAMLARDGRVDSDVLAMTGGPIPVAGLRAPLVAGNVMFAGDAGGFTHPISGAGIAAAIVSGERAGAAAASYVIAREPDALRDYEDEMRDLFEASLQRAAHRRGELMASRHFPAFRADATHRRAWIAFPEYYA